MIYDKGNFKRNIIQLAYKAKWNDREYIKIDTFYASSQL